MADRLYILRSMMRLADVLNATLVFQRPCQMLTKLHSPVVVECSVGWKRYIQTNYYFYGYSHHSNFFHDSNGTNSAPETKIDKTLAVIDVQVEQWVQNLCDGTHLQLELFFSNETTVTNGTDSSFNITALPNLPEKACFSFNSFYWFHIPAALAYWGHIRATTWTGIAQPIDPVTVDFSSYVKRDALRLLNWVMYGKVMIDSHHYHQHLHRSNTHEKSISARHAATTTVQQFYQQQYAYGVIKIRRGDYTVFYNCTTPSHVVRNWTDTIVANQRYNMTWFIFGDVEEEYWTNLTAEIHEAKLIEKHYIGQYIFERDIRLENNQTLREAYPDNYYLIRILMFLLKSATLAMGTHTHEARDAHFCVDMVPTG
jgi:hypothetical protein